ncbi:putative CRISPR-associated protein [Caenibacillus caldisaponilyticus]|uniref:putative CRISPR-associated protein n=1 Tax=Caenibacillus caldisaponilyticus TaxID=1674942 RepID=UPI0009887A72|nr:putative CRISPR-associated protein [Caenibacillus caldisaponilyticus]
MYHTVVMTCGVSLFTGKSNVFSTYNEKIPKFPVSLQEKRLTKEVVTAIENWVKEAKRMAYKTQEMPNRVSAEYSTVYTLRKRNKLSKNPTFILIFTETAGGLAAEKLLTDVFERDFKANVKVLYVDINVRDPHALNASIGDYMYRLSEALQQGEPNSTCFAPLGGYKVMTSFGYIVGSFLNYPTAYLHEDHQVLHEIPPIPLDINEQFVHEHAGLLRKCQKDYIDFNGLTAVERRLIDRYPSLFHREEGFVSLSPFGQFLFERTKYEHIFNTKYFASRQVREFIKQNRHQSLFIGQQMRELVKKLKHDEAYNDDLFHERQFSSIDSQRVQFHLYKGASGGQTAFRLAYRYDDREDTLYANYLWLNHDRYEREAAMGQGIYTEQPDVLDITEQLMSVAE